MSGTLASQGSLFKIGESERERDLVSKNSVAKSNLGRNGFISSYISASQAIIKER